MARRRRRNTNHLLERAQLETRVRYGPEERALQELQATAEDDLRFGVRSARGTASGISAAIDAAEPTTRRIYTDARTSLADIGSDVAASGGLQGVIAQVAAREQAGASRRVEESRALDLSGLQQRKVGAQEGALYAVQNAGAEYRKTSAQLNRQRVGLAEDEGAFAQSNFADLQDAQAKLNLDRRRVNIQLQGLRTRQRSTEADITGIDPATGLPTAAEQNRLRDDARADANAKKNGGRTREEISKHQGIVADIQDAKETASRMRKQGFTWEQIGTLMQSPERAPGADPKLQPGNPFGGHGPKVTRAAVELARRGKLSRGTVHALQQRGVLPRRLPRSWRQQSTVDAGRQGLDSAGGLFG